MRQAESETIETLVHLQKESIAFAHTNQISQPPTPTSSEAANHPFVLQNPANLSSQNACIRILF